MNSLAQTITALAVVAFAAGWLLLRALGRGRAGGCGGGCGCPTDELRKRAKESR